MYGVKKCSNFIFFSFSYPIVPAPFIEGTLFPSLYIKLNIQKTKIMASGPITSWQIDGETVEIVADFIFSGSKITAPGVGDGQGGLACCDSWGHKESDMTE